MFCHSCGQNIADSRGAFCPYCGGAVARQVAAAPSRRLTYITIAGVIVLTALLVAITFVVLDFGVLDFGGPFGSTPGNIVAIDADSLAGDWQLSWDQTIANNPGVPFNDVRQWFNEMLVTFDAGGMGSITIIDTWNQNVLPFFWEVSDDGRLTLIAPEVGPIYTNFHTFGSSLVVTVSDLEFMLGLPDGSLYFTRLDFAHDMPATATPAPALSIEEWQASQIVGAWEFGWVENDAGNRAFDQWFQFFYFGRGVREGGPSFDWAVVAPGRLSMTGVGEFDFEIDHDTLRFIYDQWTGFSAVYFRTSGQ